MIGRHLRMMAGAAALTAALVAPAEAKQSTTPVHVCNLATHNSLGGNFVAKDTPVGSPAERYTTGLRPKPGQGGGLVNAASHSPALSVCAPPQSPGGGVK